jgi:hypothetical protein
MVKTAAKFGSRSCCRSVIEHPPVDGLHRRVFIFKWKTVGQFRTAGGLVLLSGKDAEASDVLPLVFFPGIWD